MKVNLDNPLNVQYNIVVIGVWRSLVSRLVRVQEAPGSNPGTPTKSRNLSWIPAFLYEPEASWLPSPSGFRAAESEWGIRLKQCMHCFGFESRHSDHKKEFATADSVFIVQYMSSAMHIFKTILYVVNRRGVYVLQG